MLSFCNHSSFQKHEKEQEKKRETCSVAEKNLQKEINNRHSNEHKQFQSQYKKQYKENIEKWKKELSQDPNTPKKQREAQLQYVLFRFFCIPFMNKYCFTDSIVLEIVTVNH